MKHIYSKTGRRSRRWYFHASVDASGNVQKTTQNQASSWDPTSQARAGTIWDQGTKAAAAGYSPEAKQAQGTFGGYQEGGNLGFGALTGDSAAAQQFMNPYTQQVIDANDKNWQKTNAQTVNQTNDLAAKSGAFGGSRHGVAEGVALANNNQAQQTQDAQLLSSGFDSSMGRAVQAANLGFGAAEQNANVLSPEAYAMQQQKQSFLGPQGQTESGAQTTFGGSLKTSGGIGF
jgi:hypothetical protein